MKEEYKQKYIVNDSPEYKHSRFWFRECINKQIPFIRVEQLREDFCVHWDIGNLSWELQKAVNELTKPVALSVRELIETKFRRCRGWESRDCGDIYVLTQDEAHAVAEEVGEYLFGLVELAKQELASDAG